MDIDFVLTRGVVQVEKYDELRALLQAGGRNGNPLRVKLGLDPSKPDLTLGHGVVLRKLRQFQELGHQVIIIVGDWTAQLGDPSGREGAREPLTEAEVKINAQTYLDQFYTVVDEAKTEVRWQSEWFNAFTLADVFRLGYQKTVAQMLKRDDFEKRFRAGNEIYISEFLYPLLQGYDSIAVQADVELGGTDQTYNLLVGRELQERQGMPPQCILTCKLIVGLDGVQKMSKSLGNYIMLTAEPNDMYGKLMSLPDDAMRPYFEGLTSIPMPEVDEMLSAVADGTVNPRDVKMRMARAIVTEFHSSQAAQEAEEAFRRTFQEDRWPEDMPSFVLGEPMPIIAVLHAAGLVPSKSVARQLVTQGGVYLRPRGAAGPTERVTDIGRLVPAQDGVQIRAGKLKFLRIVTK
jgi:tyrosyl-tRNA synthetase